jgi:hypothetical protein
MRILLYYIFLGVVVYLLTRFFPEFSEILFFERLQDISQSEGGMITDVLRGTPMTGPGVSEEIGPAVGTVASLLGALALMIPVVWVYLITKQLRGYDESVVQAMLILPIAVAGIVIIVQYSVALAFSLAGIVAAVRFRTTLQDTKDAVYVFLAIGVGLAAGAHALGVAGILTVVFNGVILFIWQTNFGNIYADQKGRTGAPTLGAILAGPESGQTAITVGDKQLLEAMTQDDIKDVATRIARMERYLRAERGFRKKERLNAILIVHTTQVVGAQTFVENLLGELAYRWELAEVLPGSKAGAVLEYLIRLNPSVTPSVLLDRLNRAPGEQVLAAEYRSLENLF